MCLGPSGRERRQIGLWMSWRVIMVGRMESVGTVWSFWRLLLDAFCRFRKSGFQQSANGRLEQNWPRAKKGSHHQGVPLGVSAPACLLLLSSPLALAFTTSSTHTDFQSSPIRGSKHCKFFQLHRVCLARPHPTATSESGLALIKYLSCLPHSL